MVQAPGGYRMPKKPNAGSRKVTGKRDEVDRLPPLVVSYNWPDTGRSVGKPYRPGAKARPHGQVSL